MHPTKSIYGTYIRFHAGGPDSNVIHPDKTCRYDRDFRCPLYPQPGIVGQHPHCHQHVECPVRRRAARHEAASQTLYLPGRHPPAGIHRRLPRREVAPAKNPKDAAMQSYVGYRPQLNDRAYAGERPVIAVSSGIHAFPGSRSICGRTLSNPVRSDKAKGSSRPCESGFVAVLSVAERGFYRISRPGTAYGPKHPGRQKGSYAPEPCRITPIRALYSFRPCESGFVAVLSVAERVFYGISRPGTAYGSKHSGSQQDPCAPVRYRVSERFSPK